MIILILEAYSHMEAATATLRRHADESLEAGQDCCDSPFLASNNKPAATPAGAATLESTDHLRERFERLAFRWVQVFESCTSADAVAEIEAACALARRRTAQQWHAEGRLRPLGAYAAVQKEDAPHDHPPQDHPHPAQLRRG